MKWISVEKRMPKDYQRVLATDGKKYDFLYLNNEFNFLDKPTKIKFWTPFYHNYPTEVNLKKITYWMEVELPSKKIKPLTIKQRKQIMKSAKNLQKLTLKVLNNQGEK